MTDQISNLSADKELIPVTVENVNLEILFKVDKKDGQQKLTDIRRIIERLKEKFGADSLISELALCIDAEIHSLRIIGGTRQGTSDRSSGSNIQSQPVPNQQPNQNQVLPRAERTNNANDTIQSIPTNHVLTSQRFNPGTRLGTVDPKLIDYILRMEGNTLTPEDWHACVAYMNWVAQQPTPLPVQVPLEKDEVPF